MPATVEPRVRLKSRVAPARAARHIGRGDAPSRHAAPRARPSRRAPRRASSRLTSARPPARPARPPRPTHEGAPMLALVLAVPTTAQTTLLRAGSPPCAAPTG
jgi:hypothetical protein